VARHCGDCGLSKQTLLGVRDSQSPHLEVIEAGRSSRLGLWVKPWQYGIKFNHVCNIIIWGGPAGEQLCGEGPGCPGG